MNGDVRTTGFRTLTPVREVLARIDLTDHCRIEESEPIKTACGRVLAARVVSPVDVPHFCRAAMDGFAARAADLPGTLPIIGEAKPGRAFAGPCPPGATVRVFTGAPVPDGADVVVPVERCLAGETAVLFSETFPQNKHVAAIGEDVAAGAEVLTRGRVLRPQDVGLLSALGISTVAVYAKPRVKILVTGSELLPPGTPPHGYRIADSNSVMLKAFTERDGGTVSEIVHVQDDPGHIRAEVLTTNWDLLLVTGGTSVGKEDFTAQVIKDIAPDTFLHGLDMKPGMPTGYATLPDQRVIHMLPGNPVACLFAYDLLARLSLRRLAGRSTHWPYEMMTATLSEAIVSKPGRVDYVRLNLDRRSQRVTPVAQPGSANLSSVVSADAFLIVDDAVERIEAGTTVQVFLYD